jgi:hypothetical protein
MPPWKDVPDEIKKRFPPPPQRETFSSADDYEEALGYWQDRVGRNIGLVMQQHESSLRKYMQDASMLVPKFSCQTQSGWHIQWPKDDPHVVHAASQEELIPLLASWLRQLGRSGNAGPHVEAENSCPTCR